MNIEENRLIGDFLEINADIISKKFKSKLPKFISNIYYNRYKKRLIKSLNKLKKSNLILNKENLYEFFIYCYNNFPPKGSYRSVNKIIYNDNNNDNLKIEGIIKIDNLEAIIDLEDDYDGFNISVKNKDLATGNYNNFSIHCIRLESNNIIAKEVLKIINKQLLEDIIIFITDNIDR